MRASPLLSSTSLAGQALVHDLELAITAATPLPGIANVSIQDLCVPKISSTSCGQAIFVHQATDASVFSDVAQVEIGRLG